ncbi:MAG: transporter substrate-binding domain-containing protein [Catenulispora sp.]|nr:transporter substrate-binding domain-containing protein [Catenulispora sp.]
MTVTNTNTATNTKTHTATKTTNTKARTHIRTWSATTLIAAVALTAACSAAQDKGAAQPLTGQGINNNGLPTAPTAKSPTPCGREATEATWPGGTLPGPKDPVPAGGTLDKIRKRTFLIAGIDLNTYLFSYDPHHTNEPQGFDVDIAKAMARAIFGEDGHIQFRMVTLADPTTGEYAQLHNGNIDMAVHTTTITCARMQGDQHMSFSNPYYITEQKLLMPLGDDGKPQKFGLADLKGTGKKVCATLNSTAVDTIKKQAGEDAVYQAPYALDCLALLQQGKVDAVFTDDALLRGMEAQDPHVARTTAPPVQIQPYGIVTNYVSPDKPNDLTPFVNTALANLIADNGPDGWKNLYAHDLQTPPNGLPQIPDQYPLG